MNAALNISHKQLHSATEPTACIAGRIVCARRLSLDGRAITVIYASYRAEITYSHIHIFSELGEKREAYYRRIAKGKIEM